jgi:hypothetical protein
MLHLFQASRSGPGAGQFSAAPCRLNFIDLILIDEPGLEGCVMISLRQRLQCLPSLCGGMVAGLVLALIARTSSGAEPATLILVSGLPFLLAVLTGVAKTTTA